MSEPIVRVVDDDGSYARALSRLLTARGYQVTSYASGAELLAQLSSEPRGCVVMDLHMPGMDGLELQSELARRGLRLPVVFLTGAADIPSSVSAMRGGAVDFLEKRAPSEQLTAAVERALASDREQREVRERFAGLTERELEVLRHVLRGRMNKQIAADLGIHERTVKLHRTAVTSKVGVRSVAELATLARDAGLV
ncbi:MAG: response regulator transcription factor [Betaproteobacteria bacterium]|nr:response regulator transcription factor [Betaproteobacteria bacterium]